MQSKGVVLSTKKEKIVAWRDFSSFSFQLEVFRHCVIQMRELKCKQTNQPLNNSELSKLSEVLIRDHSGVWMILSPVRTQVHLLSLAYHDLRPLLTLPDTLHSVQTSLALIMLCGSWGDRQQRREIPVWMSWVESISPILNTIFLPYMLSLVRFSLNYPILKRNWHLYAWICIRLFF